VTRSVWTLNGTTAQFDDGTLRGRIDLLAPLRGLRVLTYRGVAVESGSVLGVDLGKVAADDLSLPETYARVDDLVATYRQSESRPYRLQAYWRRVAIGDGQVTGLELQVSINTSLLDTHPSVEVTTQISGADTPAGESRAAATGGRPYATLRSPGGWTYFEAVHPADKRIVCDASTMENAGEQRHVLFGEFLEKGVIVRARIRAAFFPANTTDAELDSAYDDFVNEPLPLTT
jgi:hypothetical protein